jgi:Ca-activated chloride channel family protein
MRVPLRSLREAALLVAVASIAAAGSGLRAQDPALSVRITSPLGRTGIPGAIRIVAQVHYAPSAAPREVRFFVDQKLLGAINAGPPYAVEWVDDNPFERTEIAVEAVDALGNSARDKVVLEPFEVSEVAEVNAVLLEASVQDRNGRFVKGLPPTAFSVHEDGVSQSLDLVRQEAVGATFALLVDQSTSMSRRMDFVHRTAATLAGYMTPLDRMVIAPFSKEIGAITGPTNDRATIVEGIEAIKTSGGTAILDSLRQASRILANAEGRRAMVLITDGYDEHSTTTYQEALEAVKSAGATLYVVGVGGVAGISIKGERLLRRLAVETGGRFFFPAREQQLAEVHDVLTEDVQNRYLLTYTPRNQRVDGLWRDVSVSTTDATHVIRTRPGYFAPKPPPIRPAIEFTAADPDGRYLDLTAEDLEVVENGVTQTVESFQEAVQPVSIVLALDASGSMKKKETEIVASAREFIHALRPQDRLAVVLFSDRVVFAHDLSENRQFAAEALDDYKANGGTALYDAVSDSLIRLKRTEGRRVVVVMTDGRDENNPGTGPGSTRGLHDVLKHVQDTGALVFGIGLGTKVDQGPLNEIVAQSGGRAYFPTEVTDLPGEYRRVVDDLRRRYVLGYTSSHIQRDGSWRNVQIRIKAREDAVIRSVGGYFAPSR